MDARRQQLLEEVFLAAAACEDAAAREELILQRCDGDAELANEVRLLLGGHQASGGMLDRRSLALGATPALRGSAVAPDEPETLPAGTRVGGFVLQRVVGVGGMGVVYVADQERPRRTVALKLIRPELGGMSPGVSRRFEAEADILARLHHPGIAQVFEAGTAVVETPESDATVRARQPYLAMELIDGLPISQHAEQKGLETRERLALMAQVCDAVHHAHQRGVIHRDLKPSNILVDGSGPTPQVKVLDFGVARVTDADMRVTTLRTSVGQLIGTLPYMSPEQVAGEPGEIDVRTDVYALGVVLYQLLTGRLPHDLSSRSIPEAARIIRDEHPSRLSAIRRDYRGDIDTIVAKAIEKDKGRRYQSAAELGEDLRRFLAGEPIEAKRDSIGYVLNKRLRRYRWAVMAGAVFVVVLLGLLLNSMRLAGRLERQLAAANVERGRALVEGGSLIAGSDALWREFLRNPESRQTRWALRELFAHRPVLRSLPGLSFSPNRAYLSPDGGSIAIVSSRGQVAVAAADLSLVRWQKEVGTAGASDLAYSPDGSRVYVVVNGEGVEEFVAATGEPLRMLGTEKSLARLSKLAVSPDGGTIAVAGTGGPVALLDVKTGKTRALRGGFARRGVPMLAFAPDSSGVVFSNADGEVDLLSPETLETVRHIGSIGIQARPCAFVDEGRTLVVAGQDKVLRWWDFQTGREIATVGVSPAFPTHITPLEGNRLACSGAGFMDVIDGEKHSVIATVSADKSGEFCPIRTPREMAAESGGSVLAVGAGPTVQLWELLPQPGIRQIAGSEGVWALAMELSPDARKLLTTDSNGSATLWDAVRGQRLIRQTGLSAAGMRTGVFSPDGSRVYVASVSGVVHVMDSEELNIIRSVDTGLKGVSGLDISPDGRLLALSFHSGAASLWDAKSIQKVGDLPAHGDQLNTLCFSPDSGRVALVGFKPVVSMVDLRAGEDKGGKRVAGAEGTYTGFGLAFSPDGRTVVYTGDFRRLVVAKAGTLEPIRALEGHAGQPVSVAISPDGELVASGALDGTVRFWELQTGVFLGTVQVASVEISRVLFAPDGFTVFASGAGGRVWRIDLTHFDRHIAGNVRFQMERQSDVVPPSVRTLELFGERSTGP